MNATQEKQFHLIDGYSSNGTQYLVVVIQPLTNYYNIFCIQFILLCKDVQVIKSVEKKMHITKVSIAE